MWLMQTIASEILEYQEKLLYFVGDRTLAWDAQRDYGFFLSGDLQKLPICVSGQTALGSPAWGPDDFPANSTILWNERRQMKLFKQQNLKLM